MSAFDPRLTPARPDLAARHLRGLVEAGRFVDGEWREVVEAHAPVRGHPAPDARLETEALMGERVMVYESTEEGWAWGQIEADGYVGYLPAAALARPGPAPTHRVAAPRTFIFPAPSIHQPPIAAPPLGSRLAIARRDERFAVTAAGGFVPASHVVPLDHVETDFVGVAEKFLGVPYLWGGKTTLGIDCSGLVQVALSACAVAAPRDTDLQERELGVEVVPAHDRRQLVRGDLVYWKDHVAIMRDPHTAIHANAFHMAVTIETIGTVIDRVRRERNGEIVAVKRVELPRAGYQDP